MDYPPDFPTHAQTRVTAARVKAAKELVDGIKKLADRYSEEAAIHYVMGIFSAFSHEACELGKLNIWASARIEYEADKFLRALAINAQDECDQLGLHVADMLSSHRLVTVMSSSILRWELPPRPIRPKIFRAFKNSTEWRRYQGELLEVAGLQSRPDVSTSAPLATNTIEPRKGYRSEVRQWMKANGISGVKAAAKRLAVSDSTLKSIMSTKGEIRYSPNKLADILAKIKLSGE